MARARKPVEFVSNVPADAPAAWAYRSSAPGARRAARGTEPAASSRPPARTRKPPAAPPPAPAPAWRARGCSLQRALAFVLLPFATAVVIIRSPRR